LRRSFVSLRRRCLLVGPRPQRHLRHLFFAAAARRLRPKGLFRLVSGKRAGFAGFLVCQPPAIAWSARFPDSLDSFRTCLVSRRLRTRAVRPAASCVLKSGDPTDADRGGAQPRRGPGPGASAAAGTATQNSSHFRSRWREMTILQLVFPFCLTALPPILCLL
jgi:hypothetical protein